MSNVYEIVRVFTIIEETVRELLEKVTSAVW